MGGSAAILADLAGSNLLLVPLDRRGEWYRYHHLFRDMLLAELHRLEPGLMPVLRRRAAGWCLDNGMPEEALEYSMAAGDVDAAARLVGQLAVPAYRQGRVTTIQRWFGWLEDRGGIEGHPMVAVLASLFSALTGRPVEAERWADAVDRWQYGDPARPDDPSAEAWAALLRAILCRRGVEQMRADADEAVRRFAAESFVTPAPALLQGIARILCGDLDGGDLSLEDAVSIGEEPARPMISRSRCASDRWWRWHAANGTGPRSSPGEHAPSCAGPGSRRATRHPLSARCEPAQPCTGEMSRRRAGNSSVPSTCGRC